MPRHIDANPRLINPASVWPETLVMEIDDELFAALGTTSADRGHRLTEALRAALGESAEELRGVPVERIPGGPATICLRRDGSLSNRLRYAARRARTTPVDVVHAAVHAHLAG
jgi:hypothetical protein